MIPRWITVLRFLDNSTLSLPEGEQAERIIWRLRLEGKDFLVTHSLMWVFP